MKRFSILLLALPATAVLATVSLAQTPPGEPLALSSAAAVRQALKQSPAAALARDDLELALVEARRARPHFRPNVIFSAAQRVGGPKVRLPGRRSQTVVPNAETTVALSLRQPLLQFGAGKAPSRRADALGLIARNEYQVALLDLALEVRTAYYAALQAADGLAIAERAVQLAERQVALVDLLMERGRAARIHQLEANKGRLQALSGLAGAQQGSRLAQANLARLIGAPIDQTMELDPEGPLPTKPGALETLVEQALANRPERLALMEAIQAASAGIRLAKASRLPRISFEGGYTVNTPLAFVPHAYWTAGLRLDAPIFSGPQHGLDVSSARKQHRRARNALRQLDDGIALEVERARVGLLTAQRRTEIFRLTLDDANEALEITFARFETGLDLRVEIESARLAASRAERDVAQARYDQRVAQAQLDRAIGRDREVPPARDHKSARRH